MQKEKEKEKQPAVYGGPDDMVIDLNQEPEGCNTAPEEQLPEEPKKEYSEEEHLQLRRKIIEEYNKLPPLEQLLYYNDIQAVRYDDPSLLRVFAWRK